MLKPFFNKLQLEQCMLYSQVIVLCKVFTFSVYLTASNHAVLVQEPTKTQ